MTDDVSRAEQVRAEILLMHHFRGSTFHAKAPSLICAGPATETQPAKHHRRELDRVGTSLTIPQSASDRCIVPMRFGIVTKDHLPRFSTMLEVLTSENAVKRGLDLGTRFAISTIRSFIDSFHFIPCR